MTSRFKDLCLNTNRPGQSADFWSTVLGLESVPNGETFVLRGDVDQHAIWLNLVPEAKTSKARVHLDVHAASVEEVVARGATVLDPTNPWTVCRSPDGVELCVFVRPPDRLPPYRLYEIGVDSVAPEKICRWWATQLGLQPQHDPDQLWWWLEGPALPFTMVFAPVPEPKQGANWIHWDVVGSTKTYQDAGAALVRGQDDEISWDVLTDPEGNEFCVFVQ